MHRTVSLEVDGELVDVDEELAPLLVEIWSAGMRTIDCCQDTGESIAQLVDELPHLEDVRQAELGRAYIGFDSYRDAETFITALARVGPRNDFYVRMVHWAAPDAWELRAILHDFGLQSIVDEEGDGIGASRVEILDHIQVVFPRSDVAEMTRRLEVHNAGGYEPVGGLVDWSTVAVDD